MHNPEQIHQITKLLAIVWDENRELSFGGMIDSIFSLAKSSNQTEFWNMDANECLTAIADFRENQRKEREKSLLE